MIKVQSGSTIQVTNIFYDFTGAPTNPDIVKFIVYENPNKILSEHVLGEGNRLEEGKYFFNYLVPLTASPKKYIIEFYGEISGDINLDRETIYSVFVLED